MLIRLLTKISNDGIAVLNLDRNLQFYLDRNETLNIRLNVSKLYFLFSICQAKINGFSAILDFLKIQNIVGTTIENPTQKKESIPKTYFI
jgi:hypothetical protein